VPKLQSFFNASTINFIDELTRLSTFNPFRKYRRYALPKMLLINVYIFLANWSSHNFRLDNSLTWNFCTLQNFREVLIFRKCEALNISIFRRKMIPFVIHGICLSLYPLLVHFLTRCVRKTLQEANNKIKFIDISF